MKIKTKRIKTAAAVASVTLFWLAVIFVLQCLLVPKYQSGVVEGSMIAEYYKDKTRHDVVIIGDCEVYENISTVELWRKYGITSYIRGSAQQLPWQSYYLLEDTLNYETPEVVVFNVLSLKYNEPQSEAYNRMTLDGMRWSTSKVNAIRASMTDDENFADYVFPLLRYHSRWSELTNDDFKYMFSRDPVTHNGYYMRVDVRAEDEFPDPMPLADYTLGENAMSYLRRMDKLCREKGIKLVLIKAPTKFPHWYDEWDKQISDYADKNGLSYINFIKLRDEIGLDMSTDTYDAGLHLNVYGAEKMSDYFGQWLVDNCGVSDRRSDSDCMEYYKKLAENYDKEKNSQIKELEESGKLLSHVPVAVKETSILKKFIILALIALACLGLVACNSEKKDMAVDQPVESGYKVIIKDTEIVPGAEMSSVLSALGEPKKYFESESCAFQGLDKVYTYDGVVIRTYPDKEVDYVLSVELKDDTVATEEGISIGDSRDKVIETYGESPSQSTDSSLSYAKGGSVVSFMFGNDGSVSSITYTLASQDSDK